MTVNTRVIRILLHANTLPFIEIQEGLRIQVLPNMTYLPNCQKHQFAAFIADCGMLVVWDDEPKKILGRVERLEAAVLKMIWGNESAYPEEMPPDKKEVYISTDEVNGDPESLEEKPRKLVLIQPVLSAFTLFLAFTALGAGYREVALEVATDHSYLRVLFVLSIIPQFWLSLVRVIATSPLTFQITYTLLVLLSSLSRQRCSNHRTDWPNEPKLQIIFRNRASTAERRPRTTSTCHYSMSSLQRRPPLCHRTDSSLDQGRHIHVRNARRHGQHHGQ
jgi:hypothetical protein